jgi:hypothetical protein
VVVCVDGGAGISVVGAYWRNGRRAVKLPNTQSGTDAVAVVVFIIVIIVSVVIVFVVVVVVN